MRFLAGIYQATLMTHMVYSGTKGVPSSLDDVQSFSQQNRLPREVITGNTGLCLELSILYASILSHAGIDPLIFLIPGHAYPGFKMNGEYYAIEATGIGGEGIGQIADVESAFNTGMKELQEFFKSINRRSKIYDSRYSCTQSARRCSDVFKDDQFLREKVDQLAMNFGVMNANLNQAPAKNTQGGGGGGGGNNNGGNDGGGNDGGGGGNNQQTDNNNNQTSSQQRTPGPLSAMIPSGWQYVNRPNPTRQFLRERPLLQTRVQTLAFTIYLPPICRMAWLLLSNISVIGEAQCAIILMATPLQVKPIQTTALLPGKQRHNYQQWLPDSCYWL